MLDRHILDKRQAADIMTINFKAIRLVPLYDVGEHIYRIAAFADWRNFNILQGLHDHILAFLLPR